MIKRTSIIQKQCGLSASLVSFPVQITL